MSTASDRLQRALADRYTLVRELGGGGMARVWLARETALDRDVVIKVVGDGTGLSVERFAREVQLAARLQQANIVPLLTAGDADGIPFYTMPYVAGHSLRERLVRGPVPLAEALDVLRDVARALAYAHGEGVVHRDIKPENILLSAGAAVVTDFGIARALSAARTIDTAEGATGGTLTQAGTSLGTPAYMAPEQALGDAIDARADLYAWGVVAHELLAGRHPFAHHTTASKLVAAQVQETPPPLPATVPASLRLLVTQCLAKDPGERPREAAAVLAALAAVQTGGGALATRDAAKHRTRWWLIAAAVLGMAVVGGYVARRADDAPPTGTAPARTVVVVPFENLGAAADAYFAAGVSDEIAGQLARLPGVQVIGRDGVQRLRAAGKSALDIARELGAAWVLSGSVRWARTPGSASVDGDTRVRIVPALVNVVTGTQVWGEPLEERLTDVFKVQGEVAGRVASALSVTLTGSQRASLGRAESAVPSARDAQLLGRSLLRQRGLGNLRQAEAQFERAIALDSGYARAWAGLAEAILLRPSFLDTTESVVAGSARAEVAALRAMALDSALPEARLALARARQAQFRFRASLDETARVLAIDSSYALAWALRTEDLVALGRLDEALAAADRAVAVDPLLPLAHHVRALAFMTLGRADSAVASSDRAIAIDPLEPNWQLTRLAYLFQAGRFDEARRGCEKAMPLTAICPAYNDPGALTPPLRRQLTAVVQSLIGTPLRAFPVIIATGYATLDMTDSAFAQLRAAVDRRDPSFLYNLWYFERRGMAKDPRWDAIVGEALRR